MAPTPAVGEKSVFLEIEQQAFRASMLLPVGCNRMHLATLLKAPAGQVVVAIGGQAATPTEEGDMELAYKVAPLMEDGKMMQARCSCFNARFVLLVFV